MNTTNFQSNLATLLAALQFCQENENNTIIDDKFEQKVLQQKPHWEHYLLDVKKQLIKALHIFESYDRQKVLTKYFQKIKSKKVLGPNTKKICFNIMLQYALEAFENETWNDAYAMFYFIVSYYPTYTKPYLYLGKATEEVKGLDQASEFYANTVNTLQDPDLYFFAADCEMNRNNKDKAKEYLIKIKEMLGNSSSLSEEQQELLNQTHSILELMEQNI